VFDLVLANPNEWIPLLIKYFFQHFFHIGVLDYNFVIRDILVFKDLARFLTWGDTR
jgi:hypothetical protein